ncbi:hypothetical protein DFJ73DRAFT_795510 [Zopfochytrium polystomum]|nr:hypothetical protein DFJ73DRAFT_795510 [Zopfochytrium polystomum]
MPFFAGNHDKPPHLAAPGALPCDLDDGHENDNKKDADTDADDDQPLPVFAKQHVSYRWQSGFVSPFLASPSPAVAALVALYPSLLPSSPTSSGLLDIGSGRGDLLLPVAAAHPSLGPFLGVELDPALVAAATATAAASLLSFSSTPVIEFHHCDVFSPSPTPTSSSSSSFSDATSTTSSINPTLEALAARASVLALFLLPAAIGRLLPWLQRQLERGRTVVSVRWGLGYSGRDLEHYRVGEGELYGLGAGRAAAGGELKVYRKRSGEPPLQFHDVLQLAANTKPTYWIPPASTKKKQQQPKQVQPPPESKAPHAEAGAVSEDEEEEFDLTEGLL